MAVDMEVLRRRRWLALLFCWFCFILFLSSSLTFIAKELHFIFISEMYLYYQKIITTSLVLEDHGDHSLDLRNLNNYFSNALTSAMSMQITSLLCWRTSILPAHVTSLLCSYTYFYCTSTDNFSAMPNKLNSCYAGKANFLYVRAISLLCR